MKRINLAAIAAVVIVGLLSLWFFRPLGSHEPQTGEKIADGETTLTSNHISRANAPTNTTRGVSILAPVKKAIEYNRALRDSIEQFKTPIEFYGLVIDEAGQPVAGAVASMSWTDLSKAGRSVRALHSDTRGSFTLNNVNGYHLSVRVEKAGYYTSISNRTSFFYAGQDVNFKPDPARPVVFTLRRKRAAEPLVAVDFPGPTIRYKLRADGNPSRV